MAISMMTPSLPAISTLGLALLLRFTASVECPSAPAIGLYLQACLVASWMYEQPQEPCVSVGGALSQRHVLTCCVCDRWAPGVQMSRAPSLPRASSAPLLM